jgi:hypothetical protein
MVKDARPPGRLPSSDLHPAVYVIAVGLVVLFTVAAWSFFDRRHDTELPLTMVSVLFLMAVLVPLALWSTWRRNRPRTTTEDEKPLSFKEWALGDFAVWQSQLRASHAAIDMLLPLAAVAFGLTAIGIVFVFTVNTVT